MVDLEKHDPPTDLIWDFSEVHIVRKVKTLTLSSSEYGACTFFRALCISFVEIGFPILSKPGKSAAWYVLDGPSSGFRRAELASSAPRRVGYLSKNNGTA